MASSHVSYVEKFDVEDTRTTSALCGEIPWSVDHFKKEFKIVIQNVEEEGMCQEFDLIGVLAPFVNSIRRILVSEVPSMAIDKVFMYNNTSIIQDEVLAHRLGLVPIKVDPRLFEYRQEGDEEGSPEDTIEFELKIKCTKNPHPQIEGIGVCSTYINRSVYTRDLKFIPRAEQQRMYGQIKPVDDNILIAKLGPGHEIELKAHCIKGIGKDHAKFSPVSTAYYRLLPEIKLLKEITGEKADKLVHCFTEGVIRVIKQKGKKVAVVADARLDTGSRNVFCDDEFEGEIELTKKKDHFIFNIESTGALTAEILFLEAVGVLKEKARYFLKELRSLEIEKTE